MHDPDVREIPILDPDYRVIFKLGPQVLDGEPAYIADTVQEYLDIMRDHEDGQMVIARAIEEDVFTLIAMTCKEDDWADDIPLAFAFGYAKPRRAAIFELLADDKPACRDRLVHEYLVDLVEHCPDELVQYLRGEWREPWRVRDETIGMVIAELERIGGYDEIVERLRA